jgi:hypothetical protein
MNTNEAAADMRDVFNESRSYYLLGFQPADPVSDGKYHQVDVTVNRKGVDIRTRQGFLAQPAPVASPGPAPAGRSTLASALSGSVPEQGIPLRVTVAAFAQPATNKADVAIVLGAREPAGAAANRDRDIDVLVTVLSPTARQLASVRQTARVPARPNAQGELSYELYSRLSLPPGRYEIRLALADTTVGQQGSVFTFVDVPNFSKGALSLSDIVVETSPALPAAPPDAFATMLPIKPTARREFTRVDRVRLFMRAYQSDGSGTTSVTVATRVHDASNRVVFQQSLAMDATEFGADHAADYRLDLPVGEFPAGEYLATIEASKGKLTVHRDVRFSVR